MKKIAITIQNYVQFYSVKPFVDSFSGADIELFVPIAIDDSGFKEMFDDIYNYLKNNNYNVFREVDMSKKYKILMEPYPMDIYLKFNYEYRIKYKYSVISAKPNLIYKVDSNIFYDAILCHSTYEKEILSNYSKTYIVGKLNYVDFRKKKNNSKKKNLLYLPTYGNLNSIDDVTEQLRNLKSKYNIIAKEHHGTNYLHSENIKSKKMYECFDKVYDSSYPLSKLLEIADVVLSDNSGSIFEALYANIPVCICSKNMDECSLENIYSLQYTLVKKNIIPYTDNVKYIEKIIDMAISDEYILKQKKIGNELFNVSGDAILKSFSNVVDMYLSDNIEMDSIKLHKKLVNEYLEKNDKILYCEQQINAINNLNTSLLKENNLLKFENEFIKNQLKDYKKGKLYKLSTKIYSLVAKIRGNNGEK